jgi:hypothetical protein
MTTIRNPRRRPRAFRSSPRRLRRFAVRAPRGEPDVWVIHLQPGPGDPVPPEVRIRRLLKYAGRALHLKAVDIERKGPQERPEPAGRPETLPEPDRLP